MLNIMRDENEEPSHWAWAAEKAVPFIHPRPAPFSQPIVIDLMLVKVPGDITAAIAQIIEATSKGKISATEASGLVSIIEAQRKAIETEDLLERIEAIENCNRR